MGLELLIAGVMVVAFLAGAVIAGRRIKRGWSPRRQQSRQRFWFYYTLGVLVLYLAMGLCFNTFESTIIALWGVAVVGTGYAAFRPLSDREQLKNFALESGRCGRCEYDLTGNLTGICPECGWTIPPRPPVVEKPGWALWWTAWDIPYLKNWRKTRRDMIVILAMFVGLTVWFVLGPGSEMFAIFPSIMCLHFAINLLRIAAYGRREGDRTGKPTEGEAAPVEERGDHR